MLFVFVVLFSCFFAMNIGASGTAAAMGAAYGAGAVKKRTVAVAMVGIVALCGALWGGGEVAETVSSGVVPENIVTVPVAVLVMASASITLFTSNKMGIPLSTSEVTVGSLIGIGLVHGDIFVWHVLGIMLVWIILPVTAYWLARGLGKGIQRLEDHWLSKHMGKKMVRQICILFLIFFGCYEAFAAGMNNVANAIGPLIASGIVSLDHGLLLGAISMAIGSIALGGPVLETNAKKITSLSLLQGSAVSFTGGTLVIVASCFGIPVPLTQATTMSIMGIGRSQDPNGSIWKHPVVKRIILVWIISPLFALMISYSLFYLFILENPYPMMLFILALFYLEVIRIKNGQQQLV